eukprot:TRINITY_DN26817_c0_g1_i1.p1 TRINITY_DN26817_c0_g1~~TRINITY_DN26817_c0_g1_i1.p1  ORF type:complete len:376 (+),score=51.10 TRINITY_DN26817_c0_g1_i1:43-1128(+)
MHCATLLLAATLAQGETQCKQASEAKWDKLGKSVLAAYPNWGMCGHEVETAIENGVNVIVWFAMDLVKTGVVAKDLDLQCVARIAKKHKNVVHLMSIGGWNAPHPHPSRSGSAYWTEFKQWNKALIDKYDFQGFDGIDWDLEGNDSPNSPHNTFSIDTLAIMSEMTLSAREDGFIVFLTPPASYLDPFTKEYSRSVTHSPVFEWHQDFKYHGRNVYAYLIAVCGIDSFDAVSVQLYEGFSSAGYLLSHAEPGSEVAVLRKLVEAYTVQGLTVDFTGTDLGHRTFVIPPSKLLLGVANGWAQLPSPETKFTFIHPDVLHGVFLALPKDETPLGVMYWCIAEDGKVVNGETMVFSKNLSWVVG